MCDLNEILYILFNKELYLPFEDQIEPISNNSHPDEFNAHRFFQMEPDGEEDEEGVPQVCCEGDEEKPALSIFVMGLQILCAAHTEAV